MPSISRRVPTLLIAAALFCAAATARAQSQAPGLWEHSFTMKSDNGGPAAAAMAQAQQQLAAMPPAQRQQIEQMMAKSGVSLRANGTTVKACLTKQDAAKPPEARLPEGCTQSGITHSGNVMHFKYACTKPQPSSGEGEVSFVSDKAYSGHTTATTVVAGMPQKMDVDISGKWLSADCGDVKPRAAPAAQ